MVSALATQDERIEMTADNTPDAPREALPSSGEGGFPQDRLPLIQRIGLANVRIGRKIGLGFAVVDRKSVV